MNSIIRLSACYYGEGTFLHIKDSDFERLCCVKKVKITENGIPRRRLHSLVLYSAVPTVYKFYIVMARSFYFSTWNLL